MSADAFAAARRAAEAWYARHDCTHAHCPDGCEHPAPEVGADGEMYCMRCWFLYGTPTRMVPCTPKTCED